MTNTNAGPVLPGEPELRTTLRDSGWLTWRQAKEVDQSLRAEVENYGAQCFAACDEQVAGPLRDQLGQCFRLSGSDPDGKENWRLAPRAVDAVRQLRADYDEACGEGEKLRQAMAAAQEEYLLLAVDRDSLRERVAELEREVGRQREIAADAIADAVAGGTRILDIAVENGGLSLSLEGGGAQLLAEILAKQYADSAAVNYLQLSFTSQHSAPGEAFVVTVQRVAGKTAHELRAEAEADRDLLRAENESLRDLLCSAHAGMRAYRDDGEMQDNTAHPSIDFKRDAPEQIRAALQRRSDAARAELEREWMKHPQTIEAKAQWDAVASALGADKNCPDSVLSAAHRLRAECADDLEAEVKARGDLPRRVERDLDPVRKAREILAARAAREPS
jgi:hypothetical protein